MNKQRKARLEEIDRKVQIPFNSLEQRKAINKEMEEILATESQEPFDNEDLNKISLITISAFTRIYEFVGKVVGGEKQLKDSELKSFEKMLANLPQAAEDIETQAKYYESIGLNSAVNSQREMKKILEGDYKSFLIKAIQKEKTRRQNSPGNNGGNNGKDGNNNNNNNGNNKNKDRGDGDNQNPPSDNSDQTNQKITNLQKQIDTLEEKLKNQPASDNSSSEDQKKLARLKAEIEELKRKQKDKSKENKDQDKKDNFTYGLVIGGGIVIVLLLIAVIFF